MLVWPGVALGSGVYLAAGVVLLTWDSKRNRFRRPSLGTFKTEQEAKAARLRYSIAQSDGVFSMSEVEFRRVRLDLYLDEWIELLDQERRADKITVGTQRDYETVVRSHIRPYLGRCTISQLTVPILHRWLLDIKATGVGDRTVQKAYRTLHRALADSALKENPAKLPKRHRPHVRDQRPGVYPTVEQVTPLSPTSPTAANPTEIGIPFCGESQRHTDFDEQNSSASHGPTSTLTPARSPSHKPSK